MKRLPYILIAALALGCTQEVNYNPAPQLLPQHIKKIGLHELINNTQQVGLRDKFALTIRDAFLADGRYAVVPETDANGTLWVTITRYQLTPTKFDANLVPTYYLLIIAVDIKFVDAKTNTALWDQPGLISNISYTAQTLPGGMTEEQAREQAWSDLSGRIVKRTIDGFGTETGTTRRMIDSNAPSSAPTVPTPSSPVPTVVNPY